VTLKNKNEKKSFLFLDFCAQVFKVVKKKVNSLRMATWRQEINEEMRKTMITQM